MIFSASELSSTNYIFIPSMLFSKLQCNYNPLHAKIKPGNIHLNIQHTSVGYRYCLFLYLLGQSSQGFVRSGLTTGSYVLSIRPIDPVCTRRRIERRFEFEIV